MIFYRHKSKNIESESFYVGNIPTRPGRRQINMDNPITNNKNEIINPRIGEFKTISGYHPVRPAIMIDDESKKEPSLIEPYNASHIITDSSIKTHHHRFLHRRRKAQT